MLYSMPLTEEQVCIIKSTAPVLNEKGITLCEFFYRSLLTDNPQLNAVFSQTNQQSGAQPRALAGSLLAYAQHIDDTGALSLALERICQKHASMYIQPEQYEIVGKYLLEAMAQLLGPDIFTDDVKDAWGSGYWQLATLMINREKQLYTSDPEWQSWRDFVVHDKVSEAEGLVSLIIGPKDSQPLPSFLPGQFISVNIKVPWLGYKQTRQYSLSDRPYSDHYRITVKRDETPSHQSDGYTLPDGVVSNIIHESVRIGDTIEVSKPRGVFHVDTEVDTTDPLALVSAGSGITPMVSILEALAAKQSPRRVWWVHVTRNSRTHAFKERISKLAQSLGTVNILTVYTQPLPEDRLGFDYDLAGRVSAHALLADSHSVHSECCVCGPADFMKSVNEELKSCGVLEKRIKMELFGTGGLPEPEG